MYIKNSLNHMVLEMISREAFQAYRLKFVQGKNIICGVIYWQHNLPEQFQMYFDETLDKLGYSNKPKYIMSNFNIDLL